MNVMVYPGLRFSVRLDGEQQQGDAESAELEPQVQVIPEACDRIAGFLETEEVPLDQEESALPGFPQHFIGNFFLVLVAICHQTSPQGRAPLEGIIDGKPSGWRS